ncbi:MAG: hypothetical protein RR426_09420 [Oscillospiraceae bacterium]
MDATLCNALSSLPQTDATVVARARQESRGITIPQSAWCKSHGYASEKAYKEAMAKKGTLMYHAHFCFDNKAILFQEMGQLQKLLEERQIKLDRFGVSLDASMALPPALRQDNAEHHGLYFATERDWRELADFPFSQPHLGDNMIGSPASYDSCCAALRAGITTMGNVSQFFSYDDPRYPDVEARTRSTVMAIAAMGEHVDDGAMLHSNLDDGYADKCDDMGQLIGMALLEQYLVQDLLHAKLAHSFGDMVYSPRKRLVLLSALRQIHGDGVFGSMVFTNKLGREKERLDLNDAHLCTCMLVDMLGQLHYQTGHAITVMADGGLHSQVTCQEIVQKLELAKRLEGYLPEAMQLIDFAAVDAEATYLVRRGQRLKDRLLDCLSPWIDITDPQSVLLAVQKLGVKALMSAVSEQEPVPAGMFTDFYESSH